MQHDTDPALLEKAATGKESAGIPAHLRQSVFRKPFLPRQLLERIRQALGGQRGRN